MISLSPKRSRNLNASLTAQYPQRLRVVRAFSREQRQKVYVQDRLREQGSHVWSWLEDGGHVYVCGDATRMASDVHRALVEVARTWGGLDEDDATEYFARMAREKRYVRDVY